ncbi:hypothetical protein BJY52DRAFT_1304125 [Lactarius psammicola]|nr:hypothetical protein BJY52DRAFT_1304125 [Lactarius psammicola]
MSSTLPPSQITPAIPAVAIVVDSSLTLAQEWRRILLDYCTPLFARLAEGHSSFLPQLRLGFVTYGPPDCDGSPVFVNRFFAVGVHNELKEMSRLSIGRTATGGSLGMAALEGYAAAIEMFDILKGGVNQKPLRPLSLNESRDKPKEVFSYHLWHFAAGQPDDAKHPRWNNSPALDSLTWKTIPAELKKREINCSMLLVSPSPKFSKLFSDIADARLAPWFPTRPNHTILLSGFTPSPKPRAAVPSTIPAKRPAESPAEQRSPGPKISKPPSQTASPALAAAKKPVPQSSPLIPPATASAPPSSSATSPTVPPATAPNSSPPKPPARETSDGTVIDLTQSTTEIVPPTMQQGRAPPLQPNPMQQAPPAQPQPIHTPSQAQPLPTPQSQGQPSSMQPQSQPPSFPLNLKPPASADPVEMVTKLKQVEMRIAELRNKHTEATQAGRTDEANKLALILTQHIAAYKKGREFMMKILEAKRAAAAAAQGQGPSSQPAPDPAPTAGTTQHSTPTMSATPQPTPNANSRSTPRLATPRMAANPNPMSAMNPSPSHVTTNSGVGAGSGSAANANAALLQAFNPAAAQIPTQSGLSGPDAHGLGTMSQLGLSHNNPLGQQQQPMPPAFAAQMKKLVEQRNLAQNAQTHIPAGNGAGTNGGTGAPVAPAMAGGFGGATVDVQWVGTFVWQGTDPTRNEKKEVRAQVVAVAPTGNPLASTWPKVLSLVPAGPAVPMNELQEWMKKTQPVLMRVQAAPGTDDHNFGQLVKLLRERSYVGRPSALPLGHPLTLCLFDSTQLRDGRFKAWAEPR